jgi:hypothetical protein
VRTKVFCSSLADVFEDKPELVPWREDLFKLIQATPDLDWLLLTKRPENLVTMLPWIKNERQVAPHWENVWLGTSVETQAMVDLRVPLLLRIPAKVSFLSAEPLLEAIDVSKWLCRCTELGREVPTPALPGGAPRRSRRRHLRGLPTGALGHRRGESGDARPFDLEGPGLLRQSNLGSAVHQLGLWSAENPSAARTLRVATWPSGLRRCG